MPPTSPPVDLLRLAGVELGGTKAIAILTKGTRIIDRVIVPTTSPDATLGALVKQLVRWDGKARLAGLGIASFGPIRLATGAPDRGTILTSPKPGWSGAPVLAAFADRFPIPIAIDTDVNAAALAEFRWGAGQGCSVLTYVTIGTGVGGGTLVDGASLRGRLHPEVGHLISRRQPEDNFAGTCPFHGACVEGLLSGPALAARFGESPSKVPADDARWRPVAHDLAQFFATLIHAYAPQRVIVGGGVGLGAPWLLPMAIEGIKPILGGYYPDLTTTLSELIVPARLGNDAGPLGAIALAQGAAIS